MPPLRRPRSPRVNRRRPADDPSPLATFSDVIQRLGEESRRQQNEHLAALEAALPAKLLEVTALPDEELVSYLIETRRGFYDPRETVLWQQVHEAAHREVMRRLGQRRRR